ncbi:hypothetical protein AQUCO_03500125v1 [Aquilegia coerulea]|uniref:Uncharacterized protein n=1 Tax=Aquilegia coerulea TaxID=218851 RepID=A0A2G5CWE4_AQUCA|nr:hypothetical protein AQUCO_03500125v1 [Aquilegia coerulea]
MGLASNVYQPVQEHFVLAQGSTHQHSFNQIQNQVPSFQGIFPPYPFLRYPEVNGSSVVSYNHPRDQRNRFILPRLPTSQWASTSQTNNFKDQHSCN